MKLLPLLSSAAPGRRVWVLMLDHLRIDGADAKTVSLPGVEASAISSAISRELFNAFDELDLCCSSFEQYVLQDTRSSAQLVDVLGGQQEFDYFSRLLNEQGKTVGHIRIVGDDSVVTHAMTDTELTSTLSADVVWLEAISSGDDHSEVSNRLLRQVQQWKRESESDSDSSPVLIVSAIHGYARAVNAPFKSGLSESLIHVPLWIDHGTGHACRIQTLAGSYDLLPTILEFLMGSDHFEEITETRLASADSQAAELKGAPLSLAAVCSHSKPLPDRLLQLTGDSWTALRTQQYLLVHPSADDAAQVQTGYSADDEMRATRHLYLKPDDVWNVNDAIVSYVAIADQMELTAAKFQHRCP